MDMKASEQWVESQRLMRFSSRGGGNTLLSTDFFATDFPMLIPFWQFKNLQLK
jgi:hypothetical protein